jgi:hypothetical protein
VNRLGVLQLGIDDPEAPGERDAEPSGDAREHRLGLDAAGPVEEGACGHVIQDRLQPDLRLEIVVGVDALLQTLRDRQVVGLDDVAAVRAGGRLAAQKEVVDLVIDEALVALARSTTISCSRT